MSNRQERAWLFGPIPDLFLGSGLLYLVILGVLIAGGAAAQGAIPYRYFAYAILLFSGAHYGATLLRVYEHETERRTYKNFTLHATLLLVALLMGALHSPFLGSTFITIYLTWSPWHYSGQNYGISLMMLRRRGVDPSPLAKRALYATFVLSFASVVLNFHFEGGLGQADPLGYAATATSGYQFVSLDFPGALRGILMPLVGGAYLICVVVAFGLLLRGGAGRRMLPTALLVVIQAAWFSIPHLGYYFELGRDIPVLNLRAGADFQAYFVWVALGHAIQYLWITTYYARNDDRWKGYGNYLGKAFVFGNAVWAAPVLLFAPDWFRGAEYEGGLALCVAAAVNLHHFVLDGAIWKLRNPKVAAVLLRNADGDGASDRAPRATSPWPARVAWSLAVFFCVLKIVPEVELESRFPSALFHREYDRAMAILDRAAWYGRDASLLRVELANRLVQEQRFLEALPQYWRSLELEPAAHGFAAVGDLTERQIGPQQALYAYKTGLEHFPEDAELHRRMGFLLARLNRPQEALPHLEFAHHALPEDEHTRAGLERVRKKLERSGG